MIIKQLTLATLDTGTLDFGFVGENEHIKFVIKCDSVFDEYPTATASLLIKAPDNTIYPKTVEVEGYNVGWVITASDTAYPGSGQIQLTFSEDGAVVKTVIANTNIKDSLVGDDPPPDPIADWISNANQILNKVDGMTATAESLPSGDDPSVTVETVDGHYNLEFGIPAGDPGDPTEIIDDTAGVGDTTKVWSANKSATDLSELKSAIDSKAPVILRDASGDIVTFADGADNMPLKECVVQIDPVQSGSGDPSPTNVRPITGWTGANVYKSAILYEFYRGGIGDNDGQPSTSTTRMRTLEWIPYNGETTLTFIGVGMETDDRVRRIYWYDSSKTFISSNTLDSGVKQLPYTYSGFTAPTGAAYFRLVMQKSDNTQVISYSGKYLAVNPAAYPISWQTVAGTVYKGTINPLTGTLTVSFLKQNLFGEGITVERKSTNTTGLGRFTVSGITGIVIASNSQPSTLICNAYKTVSNNQTYAKNDGIGTYSSAGTVVIYDTNHNEDTAETFAAYLESIGAYVVYPLITPLTYQLDPVQITTLRESNLWADTGAISITYPADTQTYVDSAISTATDPDGNVVTVSGSTPSITGESGKRYVCGTVDSISITPPQTGIVDIVFSSGTTPTVLTVPNTVLFPAWFNPANLSASSTYEINVMDGVYGAVSVWS